ncbi:hypothetical protein KUCAC02_023205 [Chaenocephalus aceratus]|uniref:Uncharacterized protein n=1 Tax=Chaenocephalus aceratus TaxID=36190 RepID=A0ACB9XPA9_CHAAC|nr:hypothetical protein KUCAC02_023205 [Chaenocephalus aceratus]
MPLLRTLLSALLLVLSVSEPLNSPEENENEVFKHPEAEHTKSQNQVMENVIGNLSEPTPSNTPSTALESLTTTVSPSTSLPPQCPGNQVKLENSSVCSCPSGMVKDGDNCSCPEGFTLEGAAGCKAAPLTTTVSPSTSLPPQCLGNQVRLENSSVCSCPSGMVKDGDNCSCPGGFTLEGAAGCKAAPLTTTVSPSTSLPPQCPGNQVKLENSSVCSCPSGMVKDGDNCSCPGGFTLEGAAGCKDVDECEVGGPCGLHADCANTPGSYSCSCLRGYLMGAGGCKDIDECALAAVTGLQACHGDAECRNTPGAFTCSCPAGYVMALNGRSCVDVDECSFEDQCRRELGNECVNIPGSFTCRCRPGFRAEAPACVGPVCQDYNVCQDVDECSESPAVCDGQGVCENTLGSYKCVCRPGYRGNGTHCAGNCGNIIGSYFCQCYQGFNGNGHSCFDIDECALNNGHCQHNCSNQAGSFSCRCASGYQLLQDGLTCTDVDECLAVNGTCDHICMNTQGSFQCSCRAGYQLHIDSHTCVDIDECKLERGGCSQTCTNSPGGHLCHCPAPLLLHSDNHTCINVTSCKLRNGGCEHVCSVRAEGQIRCSCTAGWKLGDDQRSCVDVNECGDFTNGGCEQLCVNHPGAFHCSCRGGYEVQTDDRTKCKPVCNTQCQNYGVCVAPNSCDCPPGYPGLGCSASCSPPCAHGGTCMRWNKCLCPPGWKGAGCHTAVCELPCANGGRCVGPETCQCPSDYTGPQCLLRENGGRCVDVNKCICVGGWQGARCQIEPVQCHKPCKNGGVWCRPQQVPLRQRIYWNSLSDHALCAALPTRGHLQSSQHLHLSRGDGRPTLREADVPCGHHGGRVTWTAAGPLGIRFCTKYRLNQARVYLQAYMVGYKTQCPGRKG